MVNQLAENEMLRQQQYDSHKIQEQKLTSKINELEYENSSLTKELNYMQAKLTLILFCPCSLTLQIFLS